MGIEKFIKSVCVQTAVYWGNPQPDGYGGVTFDEARELSPPNGVRWEDKWQLITTKEGNEIVSRSEVLVTEDLDDEGYLMLGTLSDLLVYTEGPADRVEDINPRIVTNAYQIKGRTKVPMIKSKAEFVRKVYLANRMNV